MEAALAAPHLPPGMKSRTPTVIYPYPDPHYVLDHSNPSLTQSQTENRLTPHAVPSIAIALLKALQHNRSPTSTPAARRHRNDV